jgi:phosphate uptake regulator
VLERVVGPLPIGGHLGPESEATYALDGDHGERELAMRFVLVARRLERIGDNAVDIAEQTVFRVTGQQREFVDASRPNRAPSHDRVNR